MRTMWLLTMLLLATVQAGGCGGSAGVGVGDAYPPQAAPEARDSETKELPYRAEVLANDLNVPWDMAFAPDGRIFFTERPGAIRVMADGRLQAEPVFRLEAPFISRGESGLLGIALDPNYSENRYIYVYHTYEDRGAMRNRVLRLTEQDGRAAPDRVLISGLPGQLNHDGGRLRFGPDGKLYVTVGDAQDPALSQNPASLAGKILRMNADGSIPADNPSAGSYVFSRGHRNPQGLAWHPLSGQLFSSEHGQSAHDEINLIEAGANYGWPLIQGDETEPKKTDSRTGANTAAFGRSTFRAPLAHSGETTWAPSGMTFVTRGPWKNELLIANLRGTQVLRVRLAENSRSIVSITPLFREMYGRIRNMAEGPDGSLYLLTNNRDGRGSAGPDDDRVIRLKPIF